MGEGGDRGRGYGSRGMLGELRAAEGGRRLFTAHTAHCVCVWVRRLYTWRRTHCRDCPGNLACTHLTDMQHAPHHAAARARHAAHTQLPSIYVCPASCSWWRWWRSYVYMHVGGTPYPFACTCAGATRLSPALPPRPSALASIVHACVPITGACTWHRQHVPRAGPAGPPPFPRGPAAAPAAGPAPRSGAASQ